ncbi:general secretion pathway protein GspK [Bradyrhizobium sp. WYCCWR 13023]|uniref:General secretion pathway protein GspK n=1 Tax=Bradyrhizobium zhengyangense TaxID=2911009 RepID=A0A9X1RDN4_9BRAD|nr:type II secretion system protein GspK [Bradyrhizobium zhengyangense]MCG2632362.1 general secretion pathway protein GspK [Bradyrhizobium zhengyangense]
MGSLAHHLANHDMVKLVRQLSSRHHRGFALVAVVWSLGLLAILATTVIIGAKYRSRTVLDYASVATAAAAAESATNLAIAILESSPSNQIAKFPLRCQMPTGEQATIYVEPEAGKVDLNTATPSVLIALFTSLSANEKLGAQITAGILTKRKTGAGSQSPNGLPKKSRSEQSEFRTVMELDQVEGVSGPLFRNALPFVTVLSGRPEPDPEVSSETLRSLLNLKQARSGQDLKAIAGTNVTIRTDIHAENGTRFIREALVSLVSENNRPFVIREWRRGEIRQISEPAAPSSRGYSSCVLPGNAPLRSSHS